MLGADVPSLSFTVMQVKAVHQGLVLIPKEWPQMVEDDPFMQATKPVDSDRDEALACAARHDRNTAGRRSDDA